MTAPLVHEAALSLLSRHLPPPGRLLDLAAGEGALSLRLLHAGYATRAVDQCRTRYLATAVPLCELDLEEPFAARAQAWAGGPFDGCTAIEIIEHLDSPLRFLKECRALLRPGGILILSSPNVEALASRLLFLWNGRLRFFTAEERHHKSPVFGWQLVRGLSEAGLVPLETAYNRDALDCGRSKKARLGALLGRVLRPLVRGDARGEIRLVAARAV